MQRSSAYSVILVVTMVVLIVTLDILFFRHHPVWERLMINVGIVLVFTAFYFRFLR